MNIRAINRNLGVDDMKCELLAESNIMLLLDFIDDMNIKYDETMLKAFSMKRTHTVILP